MGRERIGGMYSFKICFIQCFCNLYVAKLTFV